MSQKKQISILIATALFCCGAVLCYGLFYSAPVHVYEITVTESPLEPQGGGEITEASLPNESVGDHASRSEETAAESKIVHLNTADFFELITLPGVGEVTADAIIAYREETGGFQSIEELMAVKGIGEKKFETLKPYIMVD